MHNSTSVTRPALDRTAEELEMATMSSLKLQESYKVLQQDKQGMERRLGAELAATLNKLEVVEAERDALEAKLNEVSKQPLRPSATSAFNDLDRVMLTVDRTRRAVKSGETVRYEVIGDQIETNAFALGSLDAQAAADAWSKRSQEAAAFCGKMNQELAYGTTL